MSALSAISGALLRGVPLYSGLVIQQPYPFPGHTAANPTPRPFVSQVGGAAATWHQDNIFLVEPNRKPIRREGSVSELLATTRLSWEASNSQLESAVGELKTEYVFRNVAEIRLFFSTHRATTRALSNALPELKRSFGEDVVYNLEALSDDDGFSSLYAIVVWRGSAEVAEAALEDFDERWWLNQPSQSSLTFTYELA